MLVEGKSGARPPVQVKTALPKITSQVVLPDAGYLLSEVDVDAIPYVEELNQNGISVMIGDGEYVPDVQHITPSNDTPVVVETGVRYMSSKAGFAIESFNVVTPSDSNPVALLEGDIDKLSSDGYAISSYTNVIPSSVGEEVTSGIYKVASSGWLYNQEQSGGGGGTVTETLLWTNPSPSENIAANTDITLSDSIENYRFIKVVYKITHNQPIQCEDYFTPEYLLASDVEGSGARSQPAIGLKTAASEYSNRRISAYSSDKTKLQIGKCWKAATTTELPNGCIPLYIYGVKGIYESKTKSMLLENLTITTSTDPIILSIPKGYTFLGASVTRGDASTPSGVPVIYFKDGGQNITFASGQLVRSSTNTIRPAIGDEVVSDYDNVSITFDSFTGTFDITSMTIYYVENIGGVLEFSYELVKNIVDSHPHTYELKIINNRVQINEGGVYIDIINKLVYFYADYTFVVTETPSSWNTSVMFDGSSSYILYLAPSSTNGTAHKLINIKSTTATNDPIIYLYPYNDNEIRIGHTKKYTAGENFKVWGVWSAPKA